MMCGQPTNPEWPAECYEVDQFQGLTDAGAPNEADSGLSELGDAGGGDMTLGSDIGVSSDSSRIDGGSPSAQIDAALPHGSGTGRQSNGCQQSTSGPSLFLGTFFLAVLSIARRR